MKKVHLLHTVESQRKAFEQALKPFEGECEITHEVQETWLPESVKAGEVTEKVSQEIKEHLHQLPEDLTLFVCTCSTLGDAMLVNQPDIAFELMRIDQPMASKAIEISRDIAVAAALTSTLEPTKKLLNTLAKQQGVTLSLDTILCEAAWQHFQEGTIELYHKAIAEEIKSSNTNAKVVVLAQASMAGARNFLQDYHLPVLSSPELGINYVFKHLKS